MSAADIANVDDATKEHLESYSYHLGYDVSGLKMIY